MTGTDSRSPKASAGGHPPHHHYPDEELHNVDVAHEHGDINVRLILLSGASLFAVGIMSALAMWLLINVLNSRAAANDATLSPLAMPANQQPPTPRLQTNEPAGLRKFRDKEDETLLNYGWADKDRGIAHIPIDEAKKKLLEKGLPARPAPVDGATGTHAPAMGMSSSGRTIPVK